MLVLDRALRNTNRHFNMEYQAGRSSLKPFTAQRMKEKCVCNAQTNKKRFKHQINQNPESSFILMYLL